MINRFLRGCCSRLVKVREDEWAGLGWSFCWFFCLMACYYILRPIRETMASGLSRQMDQLFFAVFVVMLLAVPAYSFLVSRWGRRKFVPIVYRFFAVWLVGFSILLVRAPTPTFGLGCTYFVWVSVFNLFVVSVFWSVMADTFESESGQRLFGLIASGGSLGGIVSSLFVGRLAAHLDTPWLLLFAIGLIEASLFCFRRLDRGCIPRATQEQAPREQATQKQSAQAPSVKPTGGGVMAGMVRVFSSPYLFGICLFMLLGKFCATTVYVQEMEAVHAAELAEHAKTALFAQENLAVQVLTILFQIVMAGRLIRGFGLPATLCVLPVAMTAALVYLAGTPTLLGVVAVQVMQRTLAYGLAEPAKAVLFTVVSREDKYKTKSFIDTVVYRGGDVAATSLCKRLHSAALMMIPITIAWCGVSWIVGRKQEALVRRQRTQENGRAE